jgi:hypothetical protein
MGVSQSEQQEAVVPAPQDIAWLAREGQDATPTRVG